MPFNLLLDKLALYIMKRVFTTNITGLFFLSILLLACNTTRLVSSWKAPDVSAQKTGKVLVIALMGNRDRNLRENVENIIVDQLQKKGISAGSAFVEYGPKTFEGTNEKDALKKLENKGYDGAITIALLDKTKERQYNPGSIGYYPMGYRRFWGYYNNVYGRIYEPGYYTVDNKFMLEANFYDLTADKLIYSAQTKSVNPASPESLASEFSSKIFDDMTKKGVFP
jgi:hypothetical protein